MWFSKVMGHAFWTRWASCATEAGDVLRNLPKMQLTVLLKQLSLRFSKELGCALQDHLDLLRVLVLLMYFGIYPRISSSVWSSSHAVREGNVPCSPE